MNGDWIDMLMISSIIILLLSLVYISEIELGVLTHPRPKMLCVHGRAETSMLPLQPCEACIADLQIRPLLVRKSPPSSIGRGGGARAGS